jgi:hypothetical protein
LERTKTRYADKTRYFKASGRLRVLELSPTSFTSRWRDATSEEAVIYSIWIQKELHEFRERFENRSMIYGYYLGDHKLTIRNKIGENPDAIYDKRKMKAGRVCTNITPPSLVKILEYFQVQPIKKADERLNRSELIKAIVETKGFHKIEDEIYTYSSDRLYYFASWILTSKLNMCRIIEKVLREKDLLFRTI